MDRINLVQDRPVEGSCEHGNEPLGTLSCKPSNFRKRVRKAINKAK
jgi:hypothetical protein